MIDPFEHSSDSLIAPAKHAFAIVPDDTVELATATKAIYVGTGGDIMLRAVDSDTDAFFLNVVSGSILPVRVRAIRANGTTASNLVGLT